MYDEIEIREIVFEAQRKIDKLFPGLKVVVIEDEREVTKADVAQALRDRQSIGMDASNNVDYASVISDRALYSSPKWAISPNDKCTRLTVDGTVEQKKPGKKTLFSKFYEWVLGMFKNIPDTSTKELSVTPVLKHKNRVPCRVFKDGKAL